MGSAGEVSKKGANDATLLDDLNEDWMISMKIDFLVFHYLCSKKDTS